MVAIRNFAWKCHIISTQCLQRGHGRPSADDSSPSEQFVRGPQERSTRVGGSIVNRLRLHRFRLDRRLIVVNERPRREFAECDVEERREE